MPLEAGRVEAVGLDLEDVAARARLQDVLGAERLPEPRDVHLQGFGRVRGRLVPEKLDQPPGGDHLAGVQKQQCEQAALLSTAVLDLALGALDLERTKDAELHFRRTYPPGCRAATGPKPLCKGDLVS